MQASLTATLHADAAALLILCANTGRLVIVDSSRAETLQKLTAAGPSQDAKGMSCYDISDADLSDIKAIGSQFSRGGSVSTPKGESDSQAMAIVILVVEDELGIRFAISEALRGLGIRVVEAKTADEAWKYLIAGGSVDLVFTDHRMPGSMTGGQLARRISAEFPAVPVIITSGHFDDSEWKGTLVPKPYSLLEVVPGLVELARRGQTKQKKTG